MRAIQSVWMLCVGMVLIGGCSYRIAKDQPKNATGVLPAASVSDLYYANVAARVITPRCLGCHDGADASFLGSYDAVTAAIGDIQFRVFEASGGQKMPKGGSLTPDEAGLLKAWIEAGAPLEAKVTDNGTGNGNAVPSPSPSGAPIDEPPVLPVAVTDSDAFKKFGSVYTNVFKPSCIGCHNPKHKKRADLTNFLSAMKWKAEIRAEAVDTDDMPDGDALSPEQETELKAWVDAADQLDLSTIIGPAP